MGPPLNSDPCSNPCSKNGVEPVADIVINHRDGNTGWADFKNPDWGLWAICGDDEAFSNPNSGVTNTPMDQRGKVEEFRKPYNSFNGEKDYAYGDFRDIDHTDARVRRDILKYLLLLKSAGYRGWRYDMVHGYHASHLALYNKRTTPTFSVGEYDWDKQTEQRGWAWCYGDDSRRSQDIQRRLRLHHPVHAQGQQDQLRPLGRVRQRRRR